MPIAATIGAVGSIGSAFIQGNAAQNAAAQQVAAQQQALAAITGIIKPITTQAQGMVSAIDPTLRGLLTPGTSAATLSQLPGFQFIQNWGQMAAANQGAKMGLGGNTLTAASDYATGTAQQYYGNIVNQLQNYLNSGLQTWTNAAGTLASGTQASLSNIGNALATGTLGTANALAGGLQGVAGNLTLPLLASRLGIGGSAGGGAWGLGGISGALSGSTGDLLSQSGIPSDRRLKEDIEPVGRLLDGQTVYRFRYRGSPITQIGLLAQEVERVVPEAVHERHGFKHVNYEIATAAAAKKAGAT